MVFTRTRSTRRRSPSKQQSRIIAALNAEVARLTLELEGRPPAPTANRATRRKTAKTAAKKTAAKPRK
jgi:hypothetical protein